MRPAELGSDVPAERLRILIVDDEVLMCRSLARVLSRQHESVEQSVGSLAGLDRVAARERFDLVLCDISMPDLDGLGFLRAAEALDAGLAGRIVLMSGVGRPDVARQLVGRNVPMVEKPLSIEAVRALARNYQRRTDG